MNENDNSGHLTQRGLERRLKRHLAKKECSFLAVTVPGFEQILKSETAKLPLVTVAGSIEGGVEFYGPPDTIYHANLQLRTSNRILQRIETFTARSYPELYNKAKKIDWELYCGFNAAVAFSVSSKTSRLHHTANIEKSVFDALSEGMSELGVKVAISKDAPIKFHIRFADDICTVSIDSTGELLYRRGYRTAVAHAPVRETTAAALLMASQWQNYPVIADPMCGSGTFLLEAWLMAADRAPGISRNFAFEKWPSFSQSKWDRFRAAAKSLEKTEKSVRLAASDISSEAISCTAANAANLQCKEFVEISKCDCLTFNKNNEYGNTGLIISNLPYGKRTGDPCELHQLYKSIGDHYRAYCRGWHFGFISADRQFPHISRLKIKDEIKFVNGGIPVTFFMGKV